MFGQPKNARNNRPGGSSWMETILEIVLYPYYLVVRFFSWLSMKLGVSWASRNMRNMMQGFPAVLAAICVLILGWGVYAHDRTELGNRYLLSAKQSLAGGDYSVARTYIEKEMQIKGGDDPESLLLLGVALEKEGQGDRCLAIMRKLAPDDKTRYGPAHLWMAQFIAANFESKPTTMNAVEKHLLRAHEYASKHSDAQESLRASAVLAVFYSQYPSTILKAEPYLRETVEKVPNLRLPLAKIYLVNGRKAEAIRLLDGVIATASKIAEGDLDKHFERLMWAEALVAKEEYAVAIEVLRKGRVSAPNDLRYAKSIAEVFAIREAVLAGTPGSSLAERFGLIQAGLATYPMHPKLLNQLLNFSNLQGKEAESAKQLLQEMQVSGNTSPALQFLLGNQAYKEGKIEAARQHWERAYSQDPSFAYVGNNLAWILAQSNPPDLPRALQMINSVIERAGLPNFFGTRGEILAKMKRYKEAVSDLEKGIQVRPDNFDLHESMAECLRALGNLDMAEIHSKKAAALKSIQNKLPLPDTMKPGVEPTEPKPAEPKAAPKAPEAKTPAPKS